MCVCIHTCSASKENIKGQETTATNSLDVKKKNLFQVALKVQTQFPASEKAKLLLSPPTIIIPQLVWEETA